ncbi:uncharacterized protein LOC118439035 [Folsomia candida]|uniref:Uncharacterized protein n=1 Tax=Folsomia candida TaxID=158441 RepID=A0A226D7S8_FOLCA|nr:uncharacterized protein LOC118439035 [Folsomia candida]OXA41595.1 hypothetical protein Fcan01_23640 [Folsomia candida]
MLDTRERLSYCGENPNHIFHILSVMNHRMFNVVPLAVSTSKMFVLHGSRNGDELLQRFVVCLPYGPNSLVELKPSILNDHPTVLESSWKRYNSDVKGLSLESSIATKFDPGVHTCSGIRRGGKIFSGRGICTHSVLERKLNFTCILSTGETNASVFNDVINYNAAVTKAAIEQGFLYPVYAIYSWVPHCGHREEFKMATVSFGNRHLEGLRALVMPLDGYTWAASGISLTLLAVLLTTVSLKDGGSFKKGITFFIQSWRWILSSLSAQYHGTSAILKAVPHFPMLIIICLLSFFLLGTVFYQGSMFSSLIAHTPLGVPSTLEYVVDSEIQIITTSRIEAGTRKPTTLLRFIMDDDVIGEMNQSRKLFRTLTNLKSRINFIFAYYMFEIGLNISEGNKVEFEDGAFKRVKDTFAITNVDFELDEVLVGVGAKRDPYIVKHTESPIFFFNSPIFVTRGCMTSFIFESCGQLAQSGLYQWWHDLDVLDILIGNVKAGSDKVLPRKVIATRFFGAKKEVVFEEAKQVPLSALVGVLGLCGGILAVAVLAFVREILSNQPFKLVACKCKRTAGMLWSVVTIQIREGRRVININFSFLSHCNTGINEESVSC